MHLFSCNAISQIDNNVFVSTVTLVCGRNIISGAPHRSILGPLLFNIFLNDLFLFVENSDLSSYADDNMLYSSGNDLEKVKQTLRQECEIVTKWFYENYRVLNSGKCHFMCLGQNTVNETFVYDNIEMKNSKEEKILGVIIDNKLRFKSYVKKLCKKSSQKIWALSRYKLLKRF